ncbi:MAG: hypothetical protein IIB63_08245 [Proteobacteria bacterium]|nr:hypothetical protein [Pseudomonadota bacterium]
MTIAIKSTIAPAVLAVFLGLAVASPAAWAFAEQTDSGTYDIDKEDAELGDYSGWNSDADRKDARSGYDLGWTLGFGRPAGRGFGRPAGRGFGRPAGRGKGDARTPADAGPSAPVRPANAADPGDGK